VSFEKRKSLDIGVRV